MRLLRLFKRREHTRDEVITSLRSLWASFGYDLSDYTDDEIEAGVMAFSRLLRHSRLSAEEASHALQRLFS